MFCAFGVLLVSVLVWLKNVVKMGLDRVCCDASMRGPRGARAFRDGEEMGAVWRPVLAGTS